MAEQLTDQQRDAVYDRGGDLLVSAAAGSGKTKVLVDRLLSYLMDENVPANLVEFLIITYTKAAAAELRGKIAAKLSERMAEHPENRHLQRQMQRLYLTKISTVHAFCGDILREYAYRLDIAPDFRVADENECRELRETAMEQVLDSAYEDPDDDFRAFVDTQGLGRNDRLVPEILAKVYDSARCHLDPAGWLRKCLENADPKDLTDAGQTVWGEYLMQDLFRYLDLQIDAMDRCAVLAADGEGMEKLAVLLCDTVNQLRHLRQSESWDDILARKNIDYGRMPVLKKCPDQDLVLRIKAVRDACKAGLAKKLKSFADSSEQTLADIRSCTAAVRGMVALVRRFETEYDRLKRSRRVLDFGDLEHRTLDLLQGSSRSGITTAAAEIGGRFREIMVDEYQDSNEVQDSIFSTLTCKGCNCFMVGDVKQSIYQFRLADPGIFMKKYEQFVPKEEATPGQGRKVLLSANFRSGGAILAGVNDVFRECMSPAVGGLSYGEAESLKEGIRHIPVGEPEVELLVLDVQESTYEEEARLVAHRVAQLLDGKHYVRQGKDALRPIRPEDIAILLRSPGSVGGYFRNALADRGIRCASGGGDDLLQTEEIGVLRSLLQTVCNPRQDIPLIAALASPVFGFTADDLAAMRAQRRYGCVYDALLRWDAPKGQMFLHILEQLRAAARSQPLSKLLETVFSLTRMDSIYAAMAGGELRSANLQAFYQLAVSFESGSRRDLGQFLDSLDALEKKGLIAAEQSVSDAVTLMSIHKSKGLEFPVVFVCGLSREFNRESVRAQVLCDKKLGLGLTAVDDKNRVRYPTIAKRAIAVKTVAESLSEELRVLYVALTRAGDRLIMTYAASKPEKDLAQLALRMDMGDRELLTGDVVCPGQWVLQAALRRTEAGELFALGGKPLRTAPGEPAWKIRCVTAPEAAAVGLPEELAEAMPADAPMLLRQSLSFRYGHEEATHAPSKQTATQRKGREKDAEAAENTQEPKVIHRSWRRPAFGEAEAGGAEFGNAMHACLQFIRYDACDSVEGVLREVERLVKAGLLTEEQGQLVDHRQIAAFFSSDLGKKLRCGGEVLREFKFSILDDGENYGAGLSGEKILLQGVVDCALLEEDGITVVDFKTDKVTEATLPEKVEHYRPQVLAYASALERIYGKPVKQMLLYFFQLDRFAELC